jgi:hypothetical protein
MTNLPEGELMEAGAMVAASGVVHPKRTDSWDWWWI